MAIGLDREFLAHITETKLFDPPGLALLAVSGGIDSVALLELMCLVNDELGLDLAVVHVSHGISKVSAGVVPQVEEMARLHGLPFFLRELALGPGATETTAREARYRVLRSVQADTGAAYLVTAHHKDDQVETVLLRFLRGSGLAGLAGIPAAGREGLVRPLLPFGKDELESWVFEKYPDAEKRPPIFADPANTDFRHDRSWIRHELLPLLRLRFGATVDSRILDVSTHAALENAAWAGALRALPGLDFVGSAHSVEVARAPLERYDKLLSKWILRVAAREVGCRLGNRRAAALLAFVTGAPSGRTMQLGDGWEAVVVFDRLRIQHSEDYQYVPAPVRLNLERGCDGEILWGRWIFEWQCGLAVTSNRDSLVAWFTYGTCEIRALKEGDRIHPMGGVGSRKLRRLLMEGRIPAGERGAYPVVTRGSTVLWAPGVCRSTDALPDRGEPAVRMEARAD